MKKILISLSIIGAVAAVAIGATTAFFSDTETSTGNTFTAGSIDLKVDSVAHFNRMVCTLGTNPATYTWQPETGFNPDSSHYPQPGTPCEGTWTETDLGAQKFFNLVDLKPGDEGEDTLSLHVYDNDAWGKMTITGVTDTGNTCKEPEIGLTADADCIGKNPGDTELDGELRENTKFSFWLDQGAIPGFQNRPQTPTADPQEGDNIWQPATEPFLSGAIPLGFNQATLCPTTGAPWWCANIRDGIIEIAPEEHKLWEALAAVRATSNCPIGTPVDGHTNYDVCHGLAVDGRLVGSATYYFGMAWQIPYTVGNEAQSDGFTGDLKFEVVQHRNNPGYGF
ncbi:MAG: von Willebrand factor type A [Parcubacteria group bacterium Athens0714_26]|nr:MAG: von Willebrand factor type A [Parcubacteria group bacterium Athens1014_26]TSD02538.1 MAG: von Willebrand factor type A [Parcubacteria group bacterium Athens0714_26]